MRLEFLLKQCSVDFHTTFIIFLLQSNFSFHVHIYQAFLHIQWERKNHKRNSFISISFVCFISLLGAKQKEKWQHDEFNLLHSCIHPHESLEYDNLQKWEWNKKYIYDISFPFIFCYFVFMNSEKKEWKLEVKNVKFNKIKIKTILFKCECSKLMNQLLLEFMKLWFLFLFEAIYIYIRFLSLVDLATC